jgi:hypothetical protein
MSVVPDPVLNPDYHHQVLRGVKAGTMAPGLPAGLPAGWTDDDNLIIRNLPLFLSDAARAWLEHLPPVQIFLTGTTWSKLSPATSRAHTCALGTPGISEAAASSQENPSGTTSGDF